LLHDMKAAGLKPNTVIYSTLINVCIKGLHRETAVKLLYEMKAVGPQPNEKCYTAAIDACSRCGHYDTAIKLLYDMKAVGLQVNEISDNAAIDACKNAGNWQFVVELTQQMKADCLMPDISTYTTAVAALQAGKQYHAAEVLHAEVLSRSLEQHWSVSDKALLDFHAYGTGMTLAALRLVSHEMCTVALMCNQVLNTMYTILLLV
jgi:pentatricopeptide repeat protein